ncbi:MAG: hypothetical protein Q4F65_05640 [Propionibacteriaceae bacterium]|nr:hypothetical protein [Propionibacteriaceae bacterium]
MTKKNPDMSLAEVGQDETDAPDLPEVLDHDPATFDVGAFVAGVRGTRMRVKIQPNAHLLARLQELADEIDACPSDDEIPDELVNEWLDTKAAFDDVRVFVVEGRSVDWARQFAKDAKARGINPQRKGLSDDAVVEHTKRLWHEQIAAQVVSPAEVVPEDIAALYAQSEVEGDKLWRAVQAVNSQPVEKLVPDFSRRVSRLSLRG